MKHAKRIGILVGACAPCVLNTSFQDESNRITKEKENNTEINIEKVRPQEYSVVVMVVYATINKDSETDNNLIER